MVQFKSLRCNTDEFTLNMPKWPQTSHDFWDLKALPFCVWWSFRLRNSVSFRLGPTPPDLLFPFPGPHPRTYQAGVEGCWAASQFLTNGLIIEAWNRITNPQSSSNMVAILSWIYETNSINQLPNRGRRNYCRSWDCHFTAASLSTLFAQAWHNKHHRLHVPKPPSVVKTVVKPELESYVSLRALVLNNTCICCTFKIHHQPIILTSPHLKRIASPRSNLPFNLCILRPSNSRFTTMAGRSK